MILPYQKFRCTTLIFDNHEKLAAIISSYSQSSRLLSVSRNTLESFVSVKPSDVNRYLGQEFDCILFDAREDFDVNAFTAICGSLVGGGELILNLPPKLADKLEQDQHSYKTDDSISPLLTRFVQKIRVSPNTRWINSDKEPEREQAPSPIEIANDFLDEQRNVIEKIKRCALGHARRPLVITANRGRGKSASLGIAAAHLVKENNKNIIITAPRKANVKIFFQHANRHYLNNCSTNSSINNIDKIASHLQKKITFISPDRLLKDKPKADFLIVDEAGAIPVQILQIMTKNYNRIVFSTTVDGYEGHGHGFEIRFKSKLAKNFPQ